MVRKIKKFLPVPQLTKNFLQGDTIYIAICTQPQKTLKYAPIYYMGYFIYASTIYIIHIYTIEVLVMFYYGGHHLNIIKVKPHSVTHDCVHIKVWKKISLNKNILAESWQRNS